MSTTPGTEAAMPGRRPAGELEAGVLTVLRRGHDHAAVLARFLTELSPDDERLLQQLLGDTGEQD